MSTHRNGVSTPSMCLFLVSLENRYIAGEHACFKRGYCIVCMFIAITVIIVYLLTWKLVDMIDNQVLIASCASRIFMQYACKMRCL